MFSSVCGLIGGSGGVRVRVGDWLVRCIARQSVLQEFSSVPQPLEFSIGMESLGLLPL